MDGGGCHNLLGENLYFAWEGDIYISGNNQLHHLSTR